MRGLVGVAAVLLVAGCASGSNEIKVAVTDDGFTPDSVVVPVGKPATLVITRQVDGTCATEAVFRESGKRYELPLGQAVRIPIATDHAATYHYNCDMDMYPSQVVVK